MNCAPCPIESGHLHLLLYMDRYLRLYGRKFRKEDHVLFIKLLYELVTIPELEISMLQSFARLLITLLKYASVIPHVAPVNRINDMCLLFRIEYIYIALNVFSFQTERKNCSHRMTWSCPGGLCMSSTRRSFTRKRNILASTGSQSRSCTLGLDVQCGKNSL